MPIPLWLQITLQILLQLILILLNAIFACAEIAVIETKGTKLDKLCGYEQHQGIVAIASEKEYVEIEDLIRIAEERGENS